MDNIQNDKPLNQTELDQIQNLITAQKETAFRIDFFKLLKPIIFVLTLAMTALPFLYFQSQMANQPAMPVIDANNSFLKNISENRSVEIYGLVLKAQNSRESEFEIIDESTQSPVPIFSDNIDLQMLVGNKVNIKGYRKLVKPANVEMVQVNSVDFK